MYTVAQQMKCTHNLKEHLLQLFLSKHRILHHTSHPTVKKREDLFDSQLILNKEKC